MKLLYPAVLWGLFIVISLLFSVHVCFAAPGEGQTGRMLFAQAPPLGITGFDGTSTTNTPIFTGQPSGTRANNVLSSGFDAVVYATGTGNVSLTVPPLNGYGTPNPSTANNGWLNAQRAATTNSISEVDLFSDDGSAFNLQSLAVECGLPVTTDVATVTVTGYRNGSQVGSPVVTTNIGPSPAPPLNWVDITTNFKGIDEIKVTIVDATNSANDVGRLGIDALNLVGPAVTNPALSNAQAGVGYTTENFTASGGTAPYTFAVVSGSLPAGMSLSSSGALSGTPTAAGTFNFSVQATDATSLTSAASPATLTVNPPAITLSPTSLPDGAYRSSYTSVTFAGSGGNAPYTYSAVGLPPGMTINASNGVLSGTPTAAGTYSIAVTVQDVTTGTGSPFSTTNFITFVVDKASLTVTANNASKMYGAAFPTFTANYSGFVGGDNASSLTTAPTFTTTATPGSPVGSYSITVSGAVDPNYAISYVGATLQVTTAPLNITANNMSMSYGGPIPAYTVSYSGFVNSDTYASLSTQPTVASTATVSSTPGTYPITASGAVDANYSISYTPGTLTVGKASLTITAVDNNMTYGGTVPALSVTYSGFANGETSSVLSTQPTVSTTATSTSPTGTYPITASGAAAANYTISYVAGTLTVGKATLTVTGTSPTRLYGAANPTLGVIYSGFVGSDNASVLTTAPTSSTTATTSSPVGAYPVTPGGGIATNYTFNYVPGTLTVSPAQVDVTANNATMIYGGAFPALGVTYSGFVNGDNASSLTTQPTLTVPATPFSPVGSYTITAMGAVDNNYVFVYHPGTLTITPAPLTITPAPATMVYGGTVPAFTASYSGFVNGDNASNLTILPTMTTTATSASPIGTYPITASGAVDPNYSISYLPGVLTVNQATLTVTADNKSMPLGGPLPALTVSYSGFIGSDNVSSLTTLPTATTTATAGSPAGNYPITPSGGSSLNYTFSYVNGTLTVQKATLTVTANPATSVYGAPLTPNGALTVSYSGFINGDNSSSLTVPPTVVNTCIPGAPAGTYALIPSGAVDPNYNIVYVDGIYTVTPAPLQISGTAETKTYGSANPALVANYIGFVNGDAPGSLTILPALSTTATTSSPAGTYPITVSGAVDPNYTITYSDGTLTVGQAPLTITAGSGAMTYGGTVPSFGVTYSGFVNGDNASALTVLPTVSTTATSTSPIGTYPTTASGASDPNYSISYVPGVLTVAPAALDVTADPETKVYGTPDPALQYTVSGLVNGDNTGIFTGSLTRAPGETVGTYPITQGTLSAGSNYTISYTGNNLVITKATQQISWTQSLLAGCNGTTQLQLTATTNSGLPVTYASSDAAVAAVTGDTVTLGQLGSAVITASQPGDSNYLAAAPVTDTVINQASSLVQVHWGNVLIFDNTGSDYSQWQWYKNGGAIQGATSQYYSETPALNGQYYVIATNNTGGQVQTCPLTITGSSASPGGISVFPNPVSRGGTVTIVSNYAATALQGARMQILDMGGMIWQQITNVQPSMQVTMPSGGGIYIINLLLSNGQKASVNVLVGQ